ncbi:MAG: ThiF family adenylyltransferase [Dysgonomonas sp.]
MFSEQEIFRRTGLLLGEDFMKRIKQVRVILFGVGGVGSWCAESLIRTGVENLTMVDFDVICASNINRQLPATTKTVNQVKTDVLKSRLEEINPNARIRVIQQMYNEETSDSFGLEKYDYIIDAIDSLSSKAHLIRTADKTNACLFSSMGAALKMDPSKIQVAEFWKVKGCPLAAALRRKLKKEGKPSKKFLCVFSDELLENKGNELYGEPASSNSRFFKAQINGTVAHITAIFGFTLAGLVIQDIQKKLPS